MPEMISFERIVEEVVEGRVIKVEMETEGEVLRERQRFHSWRFKLRKRGVSGEVEEALGKVVTGVKGKTLIFHREGWTEALEKAFEGLPQVEKKIDWEGERKRVIAREKEKEEEERKKKELWEASRMEDERQRLEIEREMAEKKVKEIVWGREGGKKE